MTVLQKRVNLAHKIKNELLAPSKSPFPEALIDTWARKNSGNGGNGGKMIIIIIDYVGDGGNDIQRLDSTVERYFLHGLAESTRKTYNLAKRRYSEFASKHPLPASEHQLCQFVSYQAEGKLCHSTIKCYLSAVRQMHVAEGYGDPSMSSMARLEQVLKGIKSLQARTRGRSLPRSAAQNERGVAEKRYHLGQHDAMGSGNPVLLRVLQVQGDHSTSSLSFR